MDETTPRMTTPERREMKLKWMGIMLAAGTVMCGAGLALFAVPGIGGTAGTLCFLLGTMLFFLAPIGFFISILAGPCPYCGHEVAVYRAKAITCSGCKQRVLVRGGKFYTT